MTTRLAIDIGGTFTDLVLDRDGVQVWVKLLTTPARPADGIMRGIEQILGETATAAAEVDLILHGTTLATNALIERKGAVTALIVTEGHRDSVEMAYENRFDQYDIDADRPPPLVPRALRLPVRERVDYRGRVLTALDDGSVEALTPGLREAGVESVAIGLLHAYANPAHEQRVAEIIAAALPDLSISLSSEVCPEIREYERQSTTCANAYIQRLMEGYLADLESRLNSDGFSCPLLLMTSGGNVVTMETAIRYPIRLVESGPAGGAIMAAHIARRLGEDRVFSFDMGGTTAKICLIDNGEPLLSRGFEVARAHRFMKGSGLPIKVPVVEMVEIGAGGGSIASVDALGRINVGPQSAGAEPGPACYGRGGAAATVTDANVVLGRIDPARFAGGAMALDSDKARAALADAVGEPLAMDPTTSAFAVSEVVDENMANAARVHAVERGMELAGRALIAFGGAAPLHAARLARKLGIARIVVPTGAGVGSAIGFLRAPVAYEVVRSRYMRLSAPDIGATNRLLAEMRAEAESVVRLGAPDAELAETRAASMRYVGQGHEIDVAIPERLTEDNAPALKLAFDDTYRAHYGRTIPDVDVEVLNWMLTVSTSPAPPDRAKEPALAEPPAPRGRRAVFDPEAGDFIDVPVYGRADLAPGARIHGPALIVEDQTTTVVASGFDAHVNGFGYIVMVHGDTEREAS
jgi:N-methylhydantoinase A